MLCQRRHEAKFVRCKLLASWSRHPSPSLPFSQWLWLGCCSGPASKRHYIARWEVLQMCCVHLHLEQYFTRTGQMLQRKPGTDWVMILLRRQSCIRRRSPSLSPDAAMHGHCSLTSSGRDGGSCWCWMSTSYTWVLLIRGSR